MAQTTNTWVPKLLAAALVAAPLAGMTGVASAAPASAGLKASSDVVQVQARRGGGAWRGGAWRGRGWRGPGFGFGLAAGALAGAAIAGPYAYGYRYYDGPVYDDYNSGYAPRECYIEDAGGRFEPCDSAP
ncbi:MAG: hypothetical protein IT538_12560 [Variibacter sp.]|nr:hypothetical protein [Variibacter sp.]